MSLPKPKCLCGCGRAARWPYLKGEALFHTRLCGYLLAVVMARTGCSFRQAQKKNVRQMYCNKEIQ